MATKIMIPTPLRPFTDKKDAVEAEGKTVGELLADLTTRHAGLKAHLYNDQGKLRSFVNVYVNDEDIRYLQKEQTPVNAGDTVSIIPSVAGGAPVAAEKAPARALMPPPSPTADATAPRGMVSDTSVNRLAENPWCAAIAMPIRTTAAAIATTPASIQLRGPNIRIASLTNTTSNAPNK